MNEDVVARIILSLVKKFNTTLRELILFPFKKESMNTYVLDKEVEIDSSTLNFYILDGKHTIATEKEIVENDNYVAPHDRYRYCKSRLLHKDVRLRFITSLCSHQNMSNKEYVDTPFIDQVMKAREKWIYSGRPNHPKNGHFGTLDLLV